MSKKKNMPSKETIQEAHAIAKATQRPGQTKEQTKLIEKGIQKGIAEYKKRQKSKARELDKKLKQSRRDLNATNDKETSGFADKPPQQPRSINVLLPWALLLASWIGFIGFMMFEV
ncbi:DUF2956 domain-containing protein [Aliikangiella marina]|uniref:DUF2956 domain-containing protein n=1 Tax=Aliikangiella marina TaxID=1712262 RepID=A0A545TGZ1_9GAMM|nr:DUF2956 domain-containing protein [Aliikangiella marina]TQV76500.1 DUF2956 domain-containing protein [Aliikangiella marina]